MKFLLVQPDYEDRALVIDSERPAAAGRISGLQQLRELLKGSRYGNPGDRFLFDARPGDFCTIDYDRWIVRLGRDFADDDEQD